MIFYLFRRKCGHHLVVVHMKLLSVIFPITSAITYYDYCISGRSAWLIGQHRNNVDFRCGVCGWFVSVSASLCAFLLSLFPMLRFRPRISFLLNYTRRDQSLRGRRVRNSLGASVSALPRSLLRRFPRQRDAPHDAANVLDAFSRNVLCAALLACWRAGRSRRRLQRLSIVSKSNNPQEISLLLLLHWGHHRRHFTPEHALSVRAVPVAVQL